MQGAVVRLQIGMGADMSTLHKELHGVENVKEVYFLAGPTDAECLIEAADVEAVTKTVMQIRGLKGVARTDTRFILPVH